MMFPPYSGMTGSSICLSGSEGFDGFPRESGVAQIVQAEAEHAARMEKMRNSVDIRRATIDAEFGDTLEIVEGEDVGMRGELVNVWDRTDGSRTFVVEISPGEIRMASRVKIIKKA